MKAIKYKNILSISICCIDHILTIHKPNSEEEVNIWNRKEYQLEVLYVIIIF